MMSCVVEKLHSFIVSISFHNVRAFKMTFQLFPLFFELSMFTHNNLIRCVCVYISVLIIIISGTSENEWKNHHSLHAQVTFHPVKLTRISSKVRERENCILFFRSHHREDFNQSPSSNK